MTDSRARATTTSTIIAAAVAAISSAVGILATTLFLFATGQSFAAGSLEASVVYFLPGALIAFVLIFAGGIFGALRSVASSLVLGISVGVVAAIVGTVLTLVAQNITWTADLILPLLSTLTAVNLPFVVASLVIVSSLGRTTFSRVSTMQLFGGVAATRGSIALVRVPSENLDEGQITHITRTAVDVALANEQWDAYLAALVENGWTPIEVDAAPDLADSVFVEDAVVMFDGTAVIASPGAVSRREEIVAVETSVRELGLDVASIQLPGTLDGGDVLKVGRTVYVGRGGRTNAEGIRQLRTIVAPLGYTVVAVPITKVLHLKSAVTALPDGTVIGYAPLVEDPSIFDRFLAVPEEGGSHVVVLSADTVLMAASAPRSAALIADLGYTVVTVDISEFEKLEGCVTCLSVRVR
ncbi:MAG: dimethylargininase [Microbacteriaceae bacterium]